MRLTVTAAAAAALSEAGLARTASPSGSLGGAALHASVARHGGCGGVGGNTDAAARRAHASRCGSPASSVLLRRPHPSLYSDTSESAPRPPVAVGAIRAESLRRRRRGGGGRHGHPSHLFRARLCAALRESQIRTAPAPGSESPRATSTAAVCLGERVRGGEREGESEQRGVRGRKGEME